MFHYEIGLKKGYPIGTAKIISDSDCLITPCLSLWLFLTPSYKHTTPLRQPCPDNMLALFFLAEHKSFMLMQLLPSLNIDLKKTIRIRVTTVWVESFNWYLVHNTNTACYQTPINIIFPESETLSNSPFMSQRFLYFVSSCHHCERFQSVFTEIRVRAGNHITSWCVSRRSRGRDEEGEDQSCVRGDEGSARWVTRHHKNWQWSKEERKDPSCWGETMAATCAPAWEGCLSIELLVLITTYVVLFNFVKLHMVNTLWHQKIQTMWS